MNEDLTDIPRDVGDDPLFCFCGEIISEDELKLHDKCVAAFNRFQKSEDPILNWPEF